MDLSRTLRPTQSLIIRDALGMKERPTICFFRRRGIVTGLWVAQGGCRLAIAIDWPTIYPRHL